MTPGPSRWWQQTDLLSGLVAAGLLALLVFALHMIFPLALGLSVLTYFGVLFVTRKPAVAVPNRHAAEETLLALRSLAPQVTSRPPREQLQNITAQARDVLGYLSTHPDADAQWRDYVRECLESALAGTQRFIALAPQLTRDGAPPAQKYGEFLTTLAQTLTGVWQRLTGEDAAGFESQIEGYRNTLQEINQVYLGGDAPK